MVYSESGIDSRRVYTSRCNSVVVGWEALHFDLEGKSEATGFRYASQFQEDGEKSHRTAGGRDGRARADRSAGCRGAAPDGVGISARTRDLAGAFGPGRRSAS